MLQNVAMEMKIQTWAKWLRRLTLLLAVLTPPAFWLWLRMAALPGWIPLADASHIDPSHFSLGDWGVVVALGVLPLLGFAPMLWYLYRLFGAFEQGVVFSLHNIRLIKGCGLWLILIDLLRIVQGMLAGPLLSISGISPPFFIVRLGISYSLIGLFIYLIAKIMELALSMKEEQDLTI